MPSTCFQFFMDRFDLVLLYQSLSETCSAQSKSGALTPARSTRCQSLRTSVQLKSSYGVYVSSHTRDFQNLTQAFLG